MKTGKTQRKYNSWTTCDPESIQALQKEASLLRKEVKAGDFPSHLFGYIVTQGSGPASDSGKRSWYTSHVRPRHIYQA